MTLIQDTKPFQILLVEDSASDISMTKEALRDSRVANEINVARDGGRSHGLPPRGGGLRGQTTT